MRANVLWPIAVIVALVVGYLWQGRGDAPSDRPRRAGAQVSKARVDALTARVAALEAEVEALQAERAEAPARPDPDVAVRPVTTAAGRVRSNARAAATDDAPGGAAAVAAALKSNDPQVRSELRKIFAKEQAAAREARFERFAERANERTRQMVADLADQADLSDDQQTLVQTRLDEERNLVMGLFRAAREDGSFPEARREAEAIRDATDAQIKAKLSDAQYEQYLELRDENSWGPPRRNRRREK